MGTLLLEPPEMRGGWQVTPPKLRPRDLLKPPERLADYQLPMLECMGPRGVGLVFRPWSPEQLHNAAKELPPVAKGGKYLGDQLTSFCQVWHPTQQELGIIMRKHLQASNFTKIQQHFPGDSNYMMKSPEWSDDPNRDYVIWVNRLCTTLQEAFPTLVDMSRITRCKQGSTESAEDYYHRLIDVHEAHCGIEKPTGDWNDGGSCSAWETLLKDAFLRGLTPDTSAETRRLCIGVEDAKAKEVLRCAKHAESLVTQRADRVTAKRDKDMHQATLTLIQQATEKHQPHGVAESHPQRENVWQRENRLYSPADICFICGQAGHWRNECPNRGQDRGRGRARSRGRGFQRRRDVYGGEGRRFDRRWENRDTRFNN